MDDKESVKNVRYHEHICGKRHKCVLTPTGQTKWNEADNNNKNNGEKKEVENINTKTNAERNAYGASFTFQDCVERCFFFLYLFSLSTLFFFLSVDWWTEHSNAIWKHKNGRIKIARFTEGKKLFYLSSTVWNLFFSGSVFGSLFCWMIWPSLSGGGGGCETAVRCYTQMQLINLVDSQM